jgi:hypothetical protein
MPTQQMGVPQYQPQAYPQQPAAPRQPSPLGQLFADREVKGALFSTVAAAGIFIAWWLGIGVGVWQEKNGPLHTGTGIQVLGIILAILFAALGGLGAFSSASSAAAQRQGGQSTSKFATGFALLGVFALLVNLFLFIGMLLVHKPG